MPERVLITGGAGFLGSHLCDKFLKEGYEVICMDNLSTGEGKNIEHLFGHERFRFIKYNVTEYLHVGGKLDYILHLASPASPVDYLEMPIQTLKVGSLGTHKALGLAKSKDATFLLASTSEIYGDPEVHPQPETYWGNVNPVGKRGVYDEAKRFAEALVMAYHRYHKVDTRIARIFNTYGPRMRIKDGRALPNFMHQAITGDDITIYGDGSQTRSLCYVDDQVEGIYSLAQSGYAEPVNIGNPEEVSVLQLAEEIIELSGSQSKITYHGLPEEDPKVRRPDTSVAEKVLNWKATTDRKSGLRETYKYFKREIEQ